MSEKHLAKLWLSQPDNKIKCELCRHNCLILNDHVGICRVRKNIDGKLYSLSYGKIIAANVDPIEKKPLYHFLPNTFSFSIATNGCNFKCPWCQNSEISQCGIDENISTIKPEKIIELAIKHNCKSISYTYTEPTIFFEYAYDCAKLAHKNNLKNVFVTNGYMTRKAIDEISPYLDAVNVDLKGFNKEIHKKTTGANLDGVLDSIKYFHEKNIWMEITTLIIPEINDSELELKQIAEFISQIDKSIPWHISRFFPRFKETSKPETSIGTMKIAEKIGKDYGLKFVYIGNVY